MDTTTSSAHGGATVTFVEPVDQDYMCILCLEVADEPVTCGRASGCAALFCNRCLQRALSARRKCPTCEFGSAQKHTNLPIKNQLLKLQVHCLYSSPGSITASSSGSKRKADENAHCSWQGAYGQLETHLKRCEFVTEPCPFSGCGASLRRHDMQEHKASCAHRVEMCMYCLEENIRHSEMAYHIGMRCSEYKVSCGACGQTITRGERAQHDSDSCAEALVPCKFRDAGCQVKLKRKDAPAHLAASAAQHNELLVKKLAALQEENNTAKQQRSTEVSALNKEISQLKKSAQESAKESAKEVSALKLKVAAL